MRTLSLLLLVGWLPAVCAQTALRVVDPVLTVDGRRVGVAGSATGEGVLVLSVPGTGTYRVAPQPFAAARVAGAFRGRTLAFAADGVSVRLTGRDSLLAADAPAFVAFEPATEEARGLARLTLGRPDPLARSAPSRGSVPRAPVGPTETAWPSASPPPPAAAVDARRLDVLAAALADARLETAAAQAERDALREELARLRRERDEALRAASLAPPRNAAPEPDAAREALRAERDALRAERDALRLQVEALLAARATVPPPETAARPAGPVEMSLPGFDLARLRNPDTVRRRLRQFVPPDGLTRTAGEVMVLFQSDPTGRVVETAVPVLVGGGLDALAESLVRDMRFNPPVVDGQPTGLRSHVVVRFAPRRIE